MQPRGFVSRGVFSDLFWSLDFQFSRKTSYQSGCFRCSALSFAALYGVSASEKLFGPSLNHWDEALVFLLMSQLTHRLTG